MKTNLTKQIFFCCVLAVGCFAQQDPMEDQKDQSSGWFIGAGLGGGYEQLLQGSNRDRPGQTYRTFHTAAWNIALKAGRYHQFNPKLGLRYYYNLDLGINLGFVGDKVSANLKSGDFYIHQVHTLNLDLILNAYSGEENSFAFVLGAGLGLAKTTSTTKYQSPDGKYSTLFYRDTYKFSEAHLTGFRAQLNAGIRWMRKQSYGLELMSKIPLTPPLQFDEGTYNNKSFTQYKPSFTLTLDFVKQF